MGSLSDAQMRLLFEAAADPLFVITTQGRIVDLNRAACELLRVERAQLLGSSLGDLGIASEPTSWISDGQRGELKLLRQDGSFVEGDYTLTPHVWPDHHLLSWRDGSPHHPWRQQWQDSQRRYQTLFEILPIGVSLADSQGNLIAANLASEEILGIPVSEHTHRRLDTPDWQILHPDGRKMSLEELPASQALQNQQVVTDVEMGVMRPDGSLRWLHVNAAPLPPPNQGVVTVFMDITDQKAAQAKLREQTAREQALNRVVQAVHSSLELEAVFRIAANQVAEIFQTEASIVQYLPEQGCWRHLVLSDQTPEQPNRLMAGDIPDQNNPFAERLKNREVVQVEDTTRIADPINQEIAQRVPGSWLMVPIVMQGKVWGSLSQFRFQQISHWQPEDVMLSQRMADQLAMAIQQSTLYQQIKETSQRDALVLESIGEGVWDWDPQTNQSQVSGRYWQILGYEADRPGYSNLEQEHARIHPDDLDRVNAAIQAHLQTGQRFHIEFRAQHRQGHYLWIRARGQAIWDEQGRPLRMLGSMEDISDKKQIEQELEHRAQRERLLRDITQQIRQSLEVSVILTSAVQQIRLILNADRVLIYRFRPDWSGDMIAESVADPWTPLLSTHLMDPCFRDDLVVSYQQGRLNRIPDIQTASLAECHFNLLNNLHVRANLVVPIVSNETLWGLLCVHHCAFPHDWQDWEVELSQQISDQLGLAIHQAELYQQVKTLASHLEEQVQERTQQIEQALKFEAILKTIIDQVRHSLDENQILATVVRELGEVLQLECCDTGIYNPDRTTSTITHEYIRSGTSAKGTTFSITDTPHAEIRSLVFLGIPTQFCDLLQPCLREQPIGKVRLVCPIQDEQNILGDMWLVKPTADGFSPQEVRLIKQVANQCAIGIRQARLYQEAQAQVQRLQELNQLKEDFIHTVSHELRTPLTSMKMAITMLEISKPSPEKQDYYLAILKAQWNRELALVNELLELQALESGTRPLVLSCLNLSLWIPPLVEPFHLRCAERQQAFQVFLDPALSPVTTDQSLLEGILLELLNNACKYTPPQQQITLAIHALTRRLRVAVTNTGVTIPASQCSQIFDKFHRIPSLDHYNQGGTGLGLAMVRKVVDLLQGSLTVQSSGGVTTFCVELPSLDTPPYP
ncbi:MAG: GAF domain-containing protein [Cyanobacteriota bacterium]|nr:GAF domain-containing protein [Cyanobacteriota bacterium]